MFNKNFVPVVHFLNVITMQFLHMRVSFFLKITYKSLKRLWSMMNANDSQIVKKNYKICTHIHIPQHTYTYMERERESDCGKTNVAKS